MLTSVGLVVALPTVVLASAVGPTPPDCAVTNSYGRCVVTAVDPGRSGSDSPAERDEEPETEQRGDVDEAPPGPDIAAQADPLPPGQGGTQAELQAIPVVTPEVLAARAVELLELRPPVPRTSVSTTGFVGLPVWLWIDGGAAATGPVSATATAGAAQVTATGRLTAVEWEMGPVGGFVRCAGTGTPWTGQDGPSPDCGYVYEQRSLPERTGGTGAWTVTATAVWTVTWSGVSGGVPIEGEQTLLVPATTTLPVGEVQVLVGGGSP